MRRRRRRRHVLAALALGVALASACGGRSALEPEPGDGGESGAGGAPSIGGGAGGAPSIAGRSGAAGSGGTPLGGAGGRLGGGAGGPSAGAAGAISAGAGGAGAGAAGAAGAAASPPAAIAGCARSTPLDGGFARCDSGLLHRPSSVGRCSNALPRPSALEPDVLLSLTQLAQAAGLSGAEIESLYTCREDTDCSERANGYCALASPEGWAPGAALATCRYGCRDDVDCGGGTLCQCAEPAGRCVSATCFEDAECGEGLLCAPHDPRSGCDGAPSTVVWACQHPDDECSLDEHCADGLWCRHRGGRRVCAPPSCG